VNTADAENLYSQNKIQKPVEEPVNSIAYVNDIVILKYHVENKR
ncbi:Hypothetical protein SRAE_0000079400, partial [Strongyloides ratti]